MLKKSVNAGYFVNWNIGKKSQRKWTRFNGTYTALYDDDGILSSMISYYHLIQRENVLRTIEIKKENGVMTEATVCRPNPDGSYSNDKKVQFEYTNAEISPAKYSKMMNYFIVGEGTNWYNNTGINNQIEGAVEVPFYDSIESKKLPYRIIFGMATVLSEK